MSLAIVGDHWQNVGNVGNCWYLLFANNCQQFYVAMKNKHDTFAPAFEKFGAFEIIKRKRVESDFRESSFYLIRFFRNED